MAACHLAACLPPVATVTADRSCLRPASRPTVWHRFCFLLPPDLAPVGLLGPAACPVLVPLPAVYFLRLPAACRLAHLAHRHFVCLPAARLLGLSSLVVVVAAVAVAGLHHPAVGRLCAPHLVVYLLQHRHRVGFSDRLIGDRRSLFVQRCQMVLAEARGSAAPAHWHQCAAIATASEKRLLLVVAYQWQRRGIQADPLPLPRVVRAPIEPHREKASQGRPFFHAPVTLFLAGWHHHSLGFQCRRAPNQNPGPRPVPAPLRAFLAAHAAAIPVVPQSTPRALDRPLPQCDAPAFQPQLDL